jgi:hypothetical protein
MVKDAVLLEELGLMHKTVFAYIGTHGMAHGLDFILKSIEPFTKTFPELHFLFLGDGAERNNLIALNKHLGLTNTTFISSVSKSEVKRYLSVMDVAMVNLRKSDTFLTVIPSKIFEAAAMHKPILLGLQGETQDIIETYNAGVCFEPGNEHSFSEKVLEIIKSENYSRFQVGCRHLAASFDRKKIALNLLKEIEITAHVK